VAGVKEVFKTKVDLNITQYLNIYICMKMFLKQAHLFKPKTVCACRRNKKRYVFLKLRILPSTMQNFLASAGAGVASG
jgi:hypothetical protein